MVLPSVMVIDDEGTFRKNVHRFLESKGFSVASCADGQAAIESFPGLQPDVVLVDYRLPDMDGLALFEKLQQLEPDIIAILITGEGSVEIAVEAMKSGFYDYLTKPVALSELALLLEKVASHSRIRNVLGYFQRREADRSALDQIVGHSGPVTELKQRILQFIQSEAGLRKATPASVLITGDTGTGKELVARALHFGGNRKDQPFIEINCAALPENLLESELFGHERGAFTDAKSRKVGLFEAADGGTLFIDEIGELDINLQAKLLKVLEQKSVRRLGSNQQRNVDVRILAATNQDLRERVEAGQFRSDLYFRLKVLEIHVPPLSQRVEDIPVLARHFMRERCQHYRRGILGFSEAALAVLKAYSWPGNVREMRNVIEQLVILHVEPEVTPASLLSITYLGAEGTARDLNGSEGFRLPPEGLDLEKLEVSLVEQALAKSDGNITGAGKLLNLSRDTMRYRIEKYGLKDSD